jgi:hypothetical protein
MQPINHIQTLPAVSKHGWWHWPYSHLTAAHSISHCGAVVICATLISNGKMLGSILLNGNLYFINTK